MSKSNLDLARAWFRKASSDFANAEICFAASRSLDTACFHCQQAAEKWLKSYLIARQIAFPFVHDLNKLLDICAQTHMDFDSLRGAAALLNPYAVVTRYDEEFWPDEHAVATAIQSSQEFRIVVQRHWPVPPTPI